MCFVLGVCAQSNFTDLSFPELVQILPVLQFFSAIFAATVTPSIDARLMTSRHYHDDITECIVLYLQAVEVIAVATEVMLKSLQTPRLCLLCVLDIIIYHTCSCFLYLLPCPNLLLKPITSVLQVKPFQLGDATHIAIYLCPFNY